jgi:transposase
LPGKVRQALLVDPEGLPAHLERVLVVLEMLRAQIASADGELKTLASEDARMRRLMTVPGVRPVTSARFVAALDDVDRFPNASSVASYLGLIPGENTTGFRTKRTRLTRAGSPQVRWALGQAAWSLYLNRPRDPMVLWAKLVAPGAAAKSPSCARAQVGARAVRPVEARDDLRASAGRATHRRVVGGCGGREQRR